MAWIASIDASQAADAAGKVIVCGGPIDYPPAGALSIAGSKAETAVELRQVRVFKADKVEFSLAGGGDVFEFVFAAGDLKPASLREGGESG